MTAEYAIVELRQYTVKPGRRDELIDIFERNFIELHDQEGAGLIGHFRDLDDPHRFVWLRGFRDMLARKRALEAIYGSDAWYANRDAVNETLLDTENVLLLRPAAPGSGFANRSGASSQGGSPGVSLVSASIWPSLEPVSTDTASRFADDGVPLLAEAGATVVATLVTEPSPNNYPRLAIREGENVFVWVSRFSDSTAYDAHLVALDRSSRWRALMDEISDRFEGAPQTLRLAPAVRSRLA